MPKQCVCWKWDRDLCKVLRHLIGALYCCIMHKISWRPFCKAICMRFLNSISVLTYLLAISWGPVLPRNITSLLLCHGFLAVQHLWSHSGAHADPSLGILEASSSAAGAEKVRRLGAGLCIALSKIVNGPACCPEMPWREKTVKETKLPIVEKFEFPFSEFVWCLGPQPGHHLIF